MGREEHEGWVGGLVTSDMRQVIHHNDELCLLSYYYDYAVHDDSTLPSSPPMFFVLFLHLIAEFMGLEE